MTRSHFLRRNGVIRIVSRYANFLQEGSWLFLSGFSDYAFFTLQQYAIRPFFSNDHRYCLVPPYQYGVQYAGLLTPFQIVGERFRRLFSLGEEGVVRFSRVVAVKVPRPPRRPSVLVLHVTTLQYNGGAIAFRRFFFRRVVRTFPGLVQGYVCLRSLVVLPSRHATV